MKKLFFVFMACCIFWGCHKEAHKKLDSEFLGKWEFAGIGGGFGQYLNYDSEGDYIRLEDNGRFEHYNKKTNITFEGSYIISQKPSCDGKTIEPTIKTTEPNKGVYYIHVNDKGQRLLLPVGCFDSGLTIFNKINLP